MFARAARAPQHPPGAETEAQACQIRSLLAEFGLVMPRSIAHIKQVPKLLQVAAKELPAPFCRLIERLLGHLKELDHQAKELEEHSVVLRFSPGADLPASVFVGVYAAPHEKDCRDMTMM